MLLTPPYTPTQQVHVPSAPGTQVQLTPKRDFNHNTAIVRVPTPSDKGTQFSKLKHFSSLKTEKNKNKNKCKP